MIYKLNLDSRDRFSGTTTAQSVYAVDWSFLPENKKFKVTFSFHHKTSTTTSLTAVNNLFVECNFGTSFENYTGSSNIEKRNNLFLGIIVTKRVLFNNITQNILCALPEQNKPVYIHSSPTNNFMTITLRTLAYATSGLNLDYLMTLFFEEIE